MPIISDSMKSGLETAPMKQRNCLHREAISNFANHTRSWVFATHRVGSKRKGVDLHDFVG